MKQKRWLPVMILLLVTALLWGFGHGRGQRTWENLHNTRLVFEKGLERSEGDWGEMNSGPALSVGGGTYTLSWDIESDADNVIHVRSTNQAAIDPDDIVIPAGRAQGSATFTSLDEIYDLQIVVDYQAGSYIRVNRIDLTGHRTANGLLTLTFLLLGAAALCALHASGWLTPGRCGALVIIGLSVLVASVPDLRSSLNNGHDAEFHLGRVLNLVHAMREGQFPVRLGTYMQNGYGAVWSAFYPDIFLYFPACMVMLGATLSYSYHVFFIAMHLVSALMMWYAAARLFKSEAAGIGASVLYTLSQYRLMDIYTRFAVGESLAMCFLPLFVLGLYEVLWGDKRRWKLLAVSAALICQSHLITTAICGVIALGVGVLSLVHVIRDRRVGSVLKAVIAAALLCAFFFAPMYTYSGQQVRTSVLLKDLNAGTYALAQLFVVPDIFGQIHETPLTNVPIGLGTPMLLAAGAALYAVLTRHTRECEDVLALLACAAGVVFALMTTELFPWGRLNSMMRGMLSYIQFPWRLLTFTSVCFAFAGGYALARMKQGSGAAMEFALLSLCVVCALPMLSDEAKKPGFLLDNTLPYWDQRFEDYSLPNANMRALSVTEPVASAGVTVEDYDKHGSRITAYVSAQQDGTVVMPLYAFDGYTAQFNGREIAIEHNETDHMQFSLGAGEEGMFEIGFVGKGYWKACDLISLAALLGMIGLSLAESKKKKA